GTLDALKEKDVAVFALAKKAIADIPMLLPASPAVVGRYADVDNKSGVWKAPANVGIDYVIAPEIIITQQEQEDLNVDTVTGKSINAIRSFTGRGPAIIWGARTLAGNDNEWRYIPVRRYFIMVEGSIEKATAPFVFEPNDSNTWIRIRGMIENYLIAQWRGGALQGTTPRDAFYVRVGLGETMTQQDLVEGRLIVEIGLAVVRPAEFINLRIVHQMLTERA
ncbi:MAG TPA: phage tail sheath C-terminal domain-containing protein, partial [Flavisolibacter sp.]|nr:phage tail sheath C-terminal domain-containing protein [Flavisolibacter sp.]